MTLYVDTSALLKRYIDEPDSSLAESYLTADEDWITARHTVVEVRRNLARLLSGDELATARAQFQRDWDRMDIVELDETTCAAAATVAEMTGARSLDSLHIAAAQRVGSIRLLTFDIRQGQAARDLGLDVLGA